MERRKHQRVSFRTEAEVQSQGNDVMLSGKVDNLSMKGMFLRAAGEVTDNPLQITILLSGTSSRLSLELMGKVVRRADDGVAIEFLEMDLDSFVHLRNIVSYNSDDADAVMDQYYLSLARREA